MQVTATATTASEASLSSTITSKEAPAPEDPNARSADTDIETPVVNTGASAGNEAEGDDRRDVAKSTAEIGRGGTGAEASNEYEDKDKENGDDGGGDDAENEGDEGGVNDASKGTEKKPQVSIGKLFSFADRRVKQLLFVGTIAAAIQAW